MQQAIINKIISSHFNAYANQWSQRLNAHSYRSRFDTVNSMLDKKITYVVDVGCGTGDYSKLFSNNLEYIGIDISSKMIEVALQLYPERLFLVGDCDPVDLPDSYADCVLAIAVIEYYDDPSFLVKEMSRITKPGGQLICGFPNRRDLNKRSAGFFLKRLKNWMRKIHTDSSKGGCQLFASPGFKKDERIVHRPYDEATAHALFAQMNFVLERVRYANFRVLEYLFGIARLQSLDIMFSRWITSMHLDRWFAPFASILVVSYRKSPR